jgi:CDP-6-deoxy-D-xylo-4-hexulose-3-dehydrase
MLAHILGFMNDMDEIINICKENDIILLEDSCETQGSTYNGIKAGNIGLMSTFSFYMGHVSSTVEGGVVCTNDEELNNILLMIRSHGWTRDLPKKEQRRLKKKHKMSDFNALYMFIYPGFNIRSTDLQAYIGLKQIKKLDYVIDKRQTNYFMYNRFIDNNYWKILPYMRDVRDIISNFAYPIIHPNRDKIVKALIKNKIETRPLVCGNMGKQPFIKDAECIVYDKNAKIVDKYGLYLPNHPDLKQDQIEFICDIVNKEINI